MGCVASISYDRWPEQGSLLGRRVRVSFHYDTTRAVLGTVVRDDLADECRLIIRLDDGRIVLSTECQYALERVPVSELIHDGDVLAGLLREGDEVHAGRHWWRVAGDRGFGWLVCERLDGEEIRTFRGDDFTDARRPAGNPEAAVADERAA